MADIVRHRQQLLGYLQRPIEPHLLYLAAKWGIADLLRDGPRPSEILVGMLGTDTAILHRLLRGMVAMGLLAETDEGAFSLAPLGELLRSDMPDSVRGDVIFISELNFVWQALPESARTGASPFRVVFGSDPFHYFGNDPATRAAFHRQMAAGGRMIVAAVTAAYDFSSFRRVVDVGVGTGRCSPQCYRRILKWKVCCSICRRRLRMQMRPSSLKRILHDWDDDRALRILANCRTAIAVDNTLVVIETIVPERVANAPDVIFSDLITLVETGGRERTQEEFAALLTTAGFVLSHVLPTSAGVNMIEASAI